MNSPLDNLKESMARLVKLADEAEERAKKLWGDNWKESYSENLEDSQENEEHI